MTTISYSNLIVNNSRQRKIYARGYTAGIMSEDFTESLIKFCKRNELSESFTYDDQESWECGFEEGGIIRDDYSRIARAKLSAAALHTN